MAPGSIGTNTRMFLSFIPVYELLFLSQCWGSVTFWCGLMDWDPNPTKDSNSFFIVFKDAKKIFAYLFLKTYPHIVFSLKNVIFFQKFCVKDLFCKHYFSPRNTFMRKGKDPEPDPDL
jgi:hypothetical protein